MNEIEQLIEEQKKKLPPELVKAIEKTAWEPVVQKIGKESELKEEQIEALEKEVLLILYAFEPPANLQQNIVRELNLSTEKSEKISDSVWKMIMEPISLKTGINDPIEPSRIPEIAPEIHPVIEKGEVVHDVKPSTFGEKKEKANLPDYRYPGGVDPYREPTN